jgi:predicted HicB family RNase H-like nuclease
MRLFIAKIRQRTCHFPHFCYKNALFSAFSKQHLNYAKVSYRIIWSQDDEEYVGLCAEFPSLSWLSSSPQKALEGITNMVEECIKQMQQDNERIPLPISSMDFSGRFTVNVSPETHRNLSITAAESGLSFNAIASAKLS